MRDETVRGSLPLFKLRSQKDREQWRKLAFPVAESIQVGAEHRKYTVDSAIMSTIILDLQPFNQVNRHVEQATCVILLNLITQGRVPDADQCLGPNLHNEGGDAEPGEDGNYSILSSLRKRIRLGRERHMEVGILALTHCVIHRVPLKLSFQGYWLNFSVDH